MFISIEKACELTGRSKNALYRLMSKGHINFVRCTKGKRFLEVAELRRVYGQLNAPVSEPSPPNDNDVSAAALNHELFTLVSLLRQELQTLSDKVEQQTQMIEQLHQGGVTVSSNASQEQPTTPAPVALDLADSPEKDPQWPPFITCYADLAKRDEIKAKYEFMAKYGKT